MTHALQPNGAVWSPKIFIRSVRKILLLSVLGRLPYSSILLDELPPEPVTRNPAAPAAHAGDEGLAKKSAGLKTLDQWREALIVGRSHLAAGILDETILLPVSIGVQIWL
ncbi:hypothetical protein QA640_33035 [Bradyrhizobium sp. CB82]|uniref:hypothetical protein n=1 Tax=Bradyrhizobium sp. CB82 TaxID=3039159 RepID=UPI0024B0F52E|nr:hypothetical protein [Bradyrhizobium sp. CB82]WFU39170.1 hypothetical protein QA640_33035 [Bradyrhizobium sp. CB82]